MTIPGFALIVLLAQNGGPQQPVAPASIEGTAVKAISGESLSKVTVVLTQIVSAQDLSRTPISGPRGINLDPTTAVTLLQRSPDAPNAPNSPRRSVTTLADGRFVFENLRPGNYQLTATAPGYAPAEYGQRSVNGRGITVTVKAGQKMQNVALTLTPEGSVTGRIVDGNGDPVSRALVQAQKVIYQEKGRSLQTVAAVPSDDRGEYRLFWLPPGQYYISAIPFDDRARNMPVIVNDSNVTVNTQMNALILRAMTATTNSAIVIARDFGPAAVSGILPGVKVTSTTGPSGETIDEAAVQVFYPAALDTSKATPVEVRPGSVTGGVNITTSISRVFRIRGTMVDTVTGRPLPAGSLNLVPRDGPMLGQPVAVQQNADLSGFEVAGVVPGSYYLYGTSGTPGTSGGLGIAMVDVAATNVDNVVIPVSPPALISGTAVVEGAPTNTILNSGARLSLTVRMDPQSPGIPGAGGGVDPDGRFFLAGLLPGDYRVLVASAAGLVPKSILYDGKDALTNGVRISGSTGGKLEIVLSNKAGRVEGNILADGKPFPNATVVLMPTFALRPQTNLYQNVQSNADGHFTIDNIPPGSYKLFAWDDVPLRAWFDAEFMSAFENKGREILIRESATETMDIPVIPQ